MPDLQTGGVRIELRVPRGCTGGEDAIDINPRVVAAAPDHYGNMLPLVGTDGACRSRYGCIRILIASGSLKPQPAAPRSLGEIDEPSLGTLGISEADNASSLESRCSRGLGRADPCRNREVALAHIMGVVGGKGFTLDRQA